VVESKKKKKGFHAIYENLHFTEGQSLKERIGEVCEGEIEYCLCLPYGHSFYVTLSWDSLCIHY